METLKTINFVIAVIFFVCYTYQFLYIPVPWLRKARPHGPAKDNRYAVLICARNEQRVIGDLIASLRGQTYSQGLLSIFVLADNCTDDTAMVARVAGANVYERFNQVQVGKGYALQELLEHLEQDYPQGFDGYFVFDADNILAPNYVEAMNRTFSTATTSSPASATARTTATTGSAPVMPCGSCGRAGISTTPGSCWAPAAPCPAPASCSAAGCWRRRAPGPSTC